MSLGRRRTVALGGGAASGGEVGWQWVCSLWGRPWRCSPEALRQPSPPRPSAGTVPVHARGASCAQRGNCCTSVACLWGVLCAFPQRLVVLSPDLQQVSMEDTARHVQPRLVGHHDRAPIGPRGPGTRLSPASGPASADCVSLLWSLCCPSRWTPAREARGWGWGTRELRLGLARGGGALPETDLSGLLDPDWPPRQKTLPLLKSVPRTALLGAVLPAAHSQSPCPRRAGTVGHRGALQAGCA